MSALSAGFGGTMGSRPKVLTSSYSSILLKISLESKVSLMQIFCPLYSNPNLCVLRYGEPIIQPNTSSIPSIINLVFLLWSCSLWYLETRKKTTSICPWVRNILIQYSLPSKGNSLISMLYSLAISRSLKSLRNLSVVMMANPSTLVPFVGISGVTACGSVEVSLEEKSNSWKAEITTATIRNTWIACLIAQAAFIVKLYKEGGQKKQRSLSICVRNYQQGGRKEKGRKVEEKMRSFYVELEDQSLDVAFIMDQNLSYLAACNGSIEVHPKLNGSIRVRFDADLIFLDSDERTGRRDGDDFVLISGVGVIDHLLCEFVIGHADIVVVLHVLHKIQIYSNAMQSGHNDGNDSCLLLLFFDLALQQIFNPLLELWFVGDQLDVLVVLGAEICDYSDHAVDRLVVMNQDVFSLRSCCILKTYDLNHKCLLTFFQLLVLLLEHYT